MRYVVAPSTGCPQKQLRNGGAEMGVTGIQQTQVSEVSGNAEQGRALTWGCQCAGCTKASSKSRRAPSHRVFPTVTQAGERPSTGSLFLQSSKKTAKIHLFSFWWEHMNHTPAFNSEALCAHLSPTSKQYNRPKRTPTELLSNCFWPRSLSPHSGKGVGLVQKKSLN